MDTFLGSLVSRSVGREGCCKQITLVYVHSVSAPLGLSPLTAHTAQALGCSTGNPLRVALGLHAPPRSKLLKLRHSRSPQRRRLSWACVLCPSQVQAAREFSKCSRCDLSPFLTLLLSFLGVQLLPLIRQMVTVQNPKKS